MTKSIGWIVNSIGILFFSTITFADTYEVGDTFHDCSTCPEMVVVPSGSFMMGSSEEEGARRRTDRNEWPQHRVTIYKPFAVGKYEVTVGQFEEFVNETRHRSDEKWRYPGFKQSADHPVVYVSWDDAQAYADWLSKKTGQSYRLLSEAEWEYVARAGTTTAYHFGSLILDNQANYGKRGSGTVAVGSYPANKFGLHDVHGNVYEWVEDCLHTTYEGAPSDGSAWISGCIKTKNKNFEDSRVLRGGSWGDLAPGNLRSASRFAVDAGIRATDFGGFGFRIARTLNP